MLKKLILVVILLLASCEKPEKTYRVFILWSGLGEYAWAKRLEKAGNNLGWECEVCCNAQKLDHYNKMVVDRLLEPHEIQKKIAAFNPDFTISLK